MAWTGARRIELRNAAAREMRPFAAGTFA